MKHKTFTEQLQQISHPLTDPQDLDPLIDMIGDAKVVMLGEASHGTSEYYIWRALLSQRLLEEKGFSFVAVEGDWPPCYETNRYIKGFTDDWRDVTQLLKNSFHRWPTWMWANKEIVGFLSWMQTMNKNLSENKQTGFYGLDVYSLWESMDAVIQYLEKTDPQAVATAKKAYKCFEPYGRDEQEYAYATALVPTSCEREVVDMLTELRKKAKTYSEKSKDAYFNAEQNALITKNAEMYYRTMIIGDAMSWNVRDHHMMETLDRLLQFYGNDAKAIVWAHNTHIGDARYTDMVRHRMVNIGQLARQKYGEEQVRLIGFGGYEGSVVAGYEWGAPMRKMDVPQAREGSWEGIAHELGGNSRMFLFSDNIPQELTEQYLDNRAIGVVYNPAHERYSNYVPTIMAKRYNAFIFFNKTHALHPLHPVHIEREETPETYPSAL